MANVHQPHSLQYARHVAVSLPSSACQDTLPAVSPIRDYLFVFHRLHTWICFCLKWTKKATHAKQNSITAYPVSLVNVV